MACLLNIFQKDDPRFRPPCDLRCAIGDQDQKKKNKKKNLCDPECIHECDKGNEFPEYLGPNHFSLLNPPDELYLVTMVKTALINLAYFFMGSTVMMILFHSLAFEHFWVVNIHIFFITTGSQLFIPVYFLMQHPLDGAAIWMKWADRQREASIVRIAGIFCVCFGSLFLLFYPDYRVITFHSFFGYLAFFMSLADAVAVVLNHCVQNSMRINIDEYICLPSFVFSSLSLITGIFKSSMRQWYPDPGIQIPIFMTFFCISYTSVIMYRPVKHIVNFINTK